MGTTTSHHKEKGSGVFRRTSTSSSYRGLLPGKRARSSAALERSVFDRPLQLGLVRC
ncbi:MAG: hypothetical protein K0S81_2599 [Rhodospirillales bacterium]|nr:hypothetical protein [Rhodospirillales bacterium]